MASLIFKSIESMWQSYATHLGGICTLSEENNPRSHSASIHAATILLSTLWTTMMIFAFWIDGGQKKMRHRIGEERSSVLPVNTPFLPPPTFKISAQNIQDNNHGAIS